MIHGYELFRVSGVPVRLHGSFVLLAMLMALAALGAGGTPAEVGLRLLAPLILFATVLAHELGHAFMARRQDVQVVDVMLTPFGGMARLGAMTDPVKEMVIAAAGPLANLVVAAVLFAGLTAVGREVDPRSLFLMDDTQGGVLDDGPFMIALSFNVLLGTLNLFPAFPMDGGRILRGGLALKIGRLSATRIAFRLGLWISLGLILLPFFTPGSAPQRWVAPVMGIFLLTYGVKERFKVEAEEGLFGDGGLFGALRGRPGGPPGGTQTDRPTDPDVIDVGGSSHVVDETRELDG